MADIIDINVYETTENVVITINPNLTTVNVNSVTNNSPVTSVNGQVGDVVLEFPSAANFVPYVGATKDVNLGVHGITTDFEQFNTTNTQTNAVGKLKWNDTDGTLDLGLKGGNVTLQIGQETVARVVNKTSTNITLSEGNYQAVRVIGAIGQRPKVDLALANNDLNSATTLGLVTETILINQEGFINTSGQVREINTTGSLQGETWLDGDILYLSGTIAGQITNIKPIAPIHTIIIGFVEYAHAIHGKIFVKVNNGYELEELHNVSAITPNDNEVLTYENASSLWKPKTVNSIIGYTPAADFEVVKKTTSHIIVDKTGKGDFTTIQEAVNLAIAQGGGKTIIVRIGTYIEKVVVNAWDISIIGEDKVKCILRNDDGRYNYPIDDAPIKISGNAFIANMTIISTHDNYPTSSDKGAYAIHTDDWDGEGGNLEIFNCELISYQNAALGSGLDSNQTITINNSVLRSFTEVGSAKLVNGALFCHSNVTSGKVNQKLIVRNSYIYSQNGYAAYINDANYTNGNGLGNDMKFYSDNSNYVSDALGIENVIHKDASISGGYSGHIILYQYSDSNNLDELNFIHKNKIYGNSKTGTWASGSDWARFGHLNYDAGTFYGYLQNSTGRIVASGADVSIKSGDFIAFETSGTERARIDNSGVFKVNNLSGTGSRVVISDASGNISAPTNFVHSGNITALNIYGNQFQVTEGYGIFKNTSSTLDIKSGGVKALTFDGASGGAATFISTVTATNLYSTGASNLATSSGNILIGTDSDNGINKLQVNGSVLISGSSSAISAIARGANITPTLTATANNDVLVGLDINPTFNNGAFTGVTNAAIRVGGNIVPSTSSILTLGSNSLLFSTVYATTMYTGAFRASTSSGFIFKSNDNSTTLCQFFNNGNLVLQNGGTFTDKGARLEVVGPSLQNGNVFTAQSAPTAKTATGTLTIANLLTNIITTTSAVAVALTLPTGTLTDAGILGGLLPLQNSFDWNIINLGTSVGIVTILAGTGHTFVGLATIQISSQATFRTVKTATNTYVTYRIC